MKNEALLATVGSEPETKGSGRDNGLSRLRQVVVDWISSRPGFTASVTMHTLILATMILWTHLTLEAVHQMPSMVPVDLVAIADATNIAPMMKEQDLLPEKELAVPPPPPTSPTVELAPTTNSKFPSDTKPLTAHPPNDQHIAASDASPNIQQPPSSGPKNARIGDQNIKGVGAQTAMTMNLLDALRNQIAHCWKPAPGPQASQQTVTFQLVLNTDGSVSRPPQISDSSAVGDDPSKSAADEAVRRAIYTCAPYSLPVSRYAEWRTTTVIFDPHMIVGMMQSNSSDPN